MNLILFILLVFLFKEYLYIYIYIYTHWFQKLSIIYYLDNDNQQKKVVYGSVFMIVFLW